MELCKQLWIKNRTWEMRKKEHLKNANSYTWNSCFVSYRFWFYLIPKWVRIKFLFCCSFLFYLSFLFPSCILDKCIVYLKFDHIYLVFRYRNSIFAYFGCSNTGYRTPWTRSLVNSFVSNDISINVSIIAQPISSFYANVCHRRQCGIRLTASVYNVYCNFALTTNHSNGTKFVQQTRWWEENEDNTIIIIFY